MIGREATLRIQNEIADPPISADLMELSEKAREVFPVLLQMTFLFCKTHNIGFLGIVEKHKVNHGKPFQLIVALVSEYSP